MYLFEVKVFNIDNMKDKEVVSSSMIGDMANLEDTRSISEIMEKLGNLMIDLNSKKGR